MSQVVYPFDGTGEASTNLVTDEIHTVTKINAAPYRMLIPTFAPLYLNNLKLEHIDLLGNKTPMTEGLDFYTSLPFMAAFRSTRQGVYGGLQIINNRTEGLISITYQTVGGEWCVDANDVYRRLLEHDYNRRTSWWENVANVPDQFPSMHHLQPIDDFLKITDLMDRLVDIRDAILQTPNNVPASYIAHMLDEKLHPKTPGDLGIPPSAFYRQATDEEVIREIIADPDGKELMVSFRQVVLFLRSKSLI